MTQAARSFALTAVSAVSAVQRLVCLALMAFVSQAAVAQPSLVGTSAEGSPGSEVLVDFGWIQGGDAAAVQVDLVWDDSLLDAGSPAAGSATVDHSLDWSEVAPGRLRITVVTAGPTALVDGTLVSVPFRIAVDAPEGSWPVVVEALVIGSTAGAEVAPAEVIDGEVTVLGPVAPAEIPTLGVLSLGLLACLLLTLGLRSLRGGGALLVVFLAFAFLLPAPVQAAVLPGDADGDGEVTSADIPVIVDQILERGIAPGDPDCNGDSSVDVLDTICVAMTAPGSPPELAPIGDLAVREREIVTFLATATDPDLPSDVLTWSLVERPVGATIDPTNGSLLWVPRADQVGSHPFRVRVSDTNGASDEETFSVSVRKLGGPPVLDDIADQELVESDSMAVTANASDPDLPDDTLSYSLMLAPAGLSIDPATGEIAWTPGSAQVGVHDVTVQVTDQEGLLDFETFSVGVLEVNVAPIASDDIYEARLGVPLVIEAPGVLGNDTDPNGDPLTAALDAGPALGDLALHADGSLDYLLEPPDRTTPVEFERVCESAETFATGNATLAVGDVDADGVNEIVVATYAGGSAGISDVVILNALDCTVELNTANGDVEAAGGVNDTSHVGLLDLDGDGDLEIIGTRHRFPADQGGGSDLRHLIALHHDGTLAWPGDGASESSPLLDATPDSTSGNHYGEAGPTFADLDADGTVEIVMAFKDGTSSGIYSGLAVYDAADGSLVWEFLSTFRQGGALTKPPTVVDLDLDGTLEVIVHNSVVDHNGGLEFELPSTPSSGTTTSGHLVLGIANVDDDPFPELFGRDLRARYLFEHDGTLTRKEDENNGSRGQIAVADFDGDGAPEFSFLTCPVAFSFNCGSLFLVVYDTDGSLLWSHEGQSDFLHTFGGAFADDWNPTAFDANRDGAMDLVMANRWQDTLSIFDGRDGSVLGVLDFTVGGAGGPKFTAIADIDQDGDAEIVHGAQAGCCALRFEVWTGTVANPLPAAPTHRNQWIFQEAYNNPDASIPTNPLPHWLQPGRNGWNLLTPEPDPLIGTTQEFTYLANDGALDSNLATVTLDILPAGNPPRFLTDPDELTTRGFQYAYAPIVVDPDLGDTVSFRLTAGPSGMTIDATTGEVRWLPDTNGAYDVTILALDTIGFATEQAWILTVGDPVTVPDVVGLPQATAEGDILAANLLVGRVREATHPTIPAGSVSDQTPIAGSVAEFGAEVALTVSLGPAPEDVDNDGDGHTETGGDCNDADDTIFPGAVDPPADGIDQDCDGFDGSEPVVEVVVEPGTLDLLQGESVRLQAYAIFADGTSQIATGLASWLSLNPGTATVSATGRVTAVADTGPAQITATVDAIVGTSDVTVTNQDGTDDDPPTVEITSPVDGESVFGPSDVLGSAEDPNLVRYELEISPAGEETFTQIGGGTTPVVAGVLGELDPTLMLNGLYTLRLAVLDAGGNETMDEVTVQVDGNQKVGNFSLAFTDLEIPVAGIPITVTRTYDSRDKRKGDFGIGWRLGLQTIELWCTNPLGEGWFVAKSGLAFSLIETRTHRCSISIPGQRAEEFDFVPDVTVSPFVPFSFISGSFRARPGTVGTLQALDGIHLAIIDPQPGEVTLRNDGDLSLFAPVRFLYTTQDRTRIEFGPSGVERIEDRNGNSLTFGMGGITHSSGQSVSFTRDSQNRITELTDPAGNIQRYAYSAAGDLAAQTDRAGNTTRFFYNRNHGLLRIEDPLKRPLARNEYDADGRLIATTSADGRRIELDHDLGAKQDVIRDSDGAQTIMTYDDQGNVLQVVDPLGNTTTHTYDADGNQTSTTNAEGETTTRTFDGDDNLLSETSPLGHTTTFTYDADNNRTGVTDARGNTTTFGYDARGNRITTTDPAGFTESSAYDAQGNVVNVIDKTGASVAFEYDGSGLETARIDGRGLREETTYDANGNPVGATDRRGFTQTLSYDARELATAATNRLGDTETFGYNVLGAIESFVDPSGKSVAVEVNGEGRGTAFVDAEGNRTEWTYATDSSLTEVLNARGEKITYQYDAADRRTNTQLPDGGAVQLGYDGVGRITSRTDARGNTTTFEYDDAGRHVKTTDALGNETLFGYDEVGNLVEQTDARGNVFRFTYDALNRRTRIELPDGNFATTTYDPEGRIASESDALGRMTTFDYDANGNLIEVTDPLGGVTTFGYDEEDNRILQTDANGHTTTFLYDAEGREIERIHPDGARFTQTFNPAGSLATSTDAAGQVTAFAYNGNQQVVSKQLADGSGRSFTYTPTNQLDTATDTRGSTTYSYDPLDRIAGVAHPEGATLSYTYDLSGNLTSSAIQTPTGPTRTIAYDWDSLDRLQRVTDSTGGTTSYQYDANGNQVAILYPNATSSHFTFDALNRLVEIDHRSGGASVERLTYTLDAVGDRTRVDYLDGASTEYQYDDLRRLVRETHRRPAGTVERDVSYTYDAVGNRMTHTDHVSGATVTYTYDDADKLLVAGTTTYTYDANGRIASKTEGTAGSTTTYEHDAEGRLAQVTAGSIKSIFEYDHQGNRVSVDEGAGVIHHLVDIVNPTGFSQVLEEYTASGSSIASYVFGTDLVSQLRGGTRHHFHIDGTGSTRLLTDSGGAVSDRYDFTGFGELTSSDGSTPNRYLFTGEQFDATSGFSYLRARYYAPEQGRFTSRDPFEGSPNEPISLHRYLYANANPIMFTDPTGRESLASITIVFPTVQDLQKSYNAYLYSVFKNTIQIAGSTLSIGAKAKQIALDALVSEHLVRDASAVNQAQVEFGAGFDVVGDLLINSQKLIGKAFDDIRTAFNKESKAFAIGLLIPKIKLKVLSLQWDFRPIIVAFASSGREGVKKTSLYIPTVEELGVLNDMVKGLFDVIDAGSKGEEPPAAARKAVLDFVFSKANS